MRHYYGMRDTGKPILRDIVPADLIGPIVTGGGQPIPPAPQPPPALGVQVTQSSVPYKSGFSTNSQT